MGFVDLTQFQLQPARNLITMGNEVNKVFYMAMYALMEDCCWDAIFLPWKEWQESPFPPGYLLPRPNAAMSA